MMIGKSRASSAAKSVLQRAGPSYFSAATALGGAATEAATVKGYTRGGGAGLFSGNLKNASGKAWTRFPKVVIIRKSSTLTLGENKRPEEEKAHGASGGGNVMKGLVASYWGVEPATITKEDGTEWKWICFRPWETYKSDTSIYLKKHHAPVTLMDKMALWTVKALRLSTDLFFQNIQLRVHVVEAHNKSCTLTLGEKQRPEEEIRVSPTAGFGSFRILDSISRCSQQFDVFFPGTVKSNKNETHLQSSTLGNLGLNFGVLGIRKNVSFPNTFYCRRCFYSGPQAEVETGRTQRSTDYIEGSPREFGSSGFGRFPQYPNRIVEANADVVHIKLMRNNAFVTLTDSKGNKKLGISAGKLVGKGGKLARYSGEAAAEDIGQKVRQMKIKSVVVKVNGSTFFRKKKQAILGFKDGYSHSHADSHPVVYVEDTTRKPHNGCRRKKQRRI